MYGEVTSGFASSVIILLKALAIFSQKDSYYYLKYLSLYKIYALIHTLAIFFQERTCQRYFTTK